MCTATDWISALANVGLAAVAGVAAVQASRGLKTWRRQAFEQQSHDLARSLLRAAYTLLDEARSLCNAVPSEDELAEAKTTAVAPEDVRNVKTTDPEAINVILNAKATKFRRLSSELRSLLREAEALWGSQWLEHFKQFEALPHELERDLRDYLWLMGGPPRGVGDEKAWAPKFDEARVRKIFTTVHGLEMDPSGWFPRLSEQIERITNDAKSGLLHRRNNAAK